ncbi:MAG: DUF2865 domain-containing protein [Rhizobiaceae bacterium]
MKGMGKGWIGLALVMACLFVPVRAFAQSAYCLQLVNELTAIDSGGGFSANSAKYQQYERAAREQRAQMVKTQRAARQNGCSAGIFSRNSALCDRIRSSLEQMSINLAKLERTRDSLGGGGGGDSRRRKSILAELQRNGCQNRISGPSGVIDARSEEPRRRTLLEQIFGVRTFRENGQRGGDGFAPDIGLGSRYGTFRTLCVRTCDGYYFPISFSTVRERFDQDEATCQNMCPGAEVQLYYHGMPSQDSEDMISYRSDQPYVSLPTAFNYRKSVNSACECRFSRGGLTEVAGGVTIRDITSEADSRDRIPTPVFKSDPGLDPETRNNLSGGLTSAYLQELNRHKDEGVKPLAAVGERKIRVVGPEFFPVQ